MISNVSFGSTAGVFTKPDLNKPQAHTKPAAAPEAAAPAAEPKKKGKAGKVVLGLVATAVAVAGLLVAGNKTGVLKDIGKYVPDTLKNAKWAEFAKEPVKAGAAALDAAGEWIGDKGMAVVDAAKNSGIGKKIAGLFDKGTPAA